MRICFSCADAYCQFCRKGLPFFDHGALSTLKLRSKPLVLAYPDGQEPIPAYNLRLLDASFCLNTTSPGLAEAFKHFPALTYLDISGTYPARDRSVLFCLRYMPQLQILKARNLSLKDDDLSLLAEAIGCSVRSLDLRDNFLTDQSVRILLEKCFKGPKEAARLQRQMMATVTGDWPSNLPPQQGVEMLDIFKSNRQDKYVHECLTTEFVSYLGFEHACGTGITHIYISGNRLSIEGVSGLVRSKRLHVLDAGTVSTRLKPPPVAVRNGQFYTVALPGAEKLIPVFHSHGAGLTYLRINHAVITQDVPSTDAKFAELEDTSGLVLPPHLVELDAEGQVVHEMGEDSIQELPAADVMIAELEGTPMEPRPQETNGHEDDTQLNEPPQADRVRRGSIFAPEVVESELVSPILTPTGGAPMSPGVPTISSVMSPLMSPISPHDSTSMSISGLGSTMGSPTSPAFSPTLRSPTLLEVPQSEAPSRKRTYSGVIDEHEARTKFRLYQTHSLLPFMLPKLQTIVLTDVPSKATSNSISQHLIQFVKDCAEEDNWAMIQASVGYALPPGRDRVRLERRYARSLFAMRRLVLEIAPETQAKYTGWRTGASYIPGMSSVEDPDCESFWTAAKNDFSFFGDEECGQPDSDSTSHMPLAAMTEKIALTTDGDAASQLPWVPVPNKNGAAAGPPALDVLAEVSRFRKVKRYLREAAVAAGRGDGFVDGFWDGEIVVVRPRS